MLQMKEVEFMNTYFVRTFKIAKNMKVV